MPIYHKLGLIPPKRHTIFENPKGGIYYEQLFGTEGFNSHSSLMYEIHRPTQVKEILNLFDFETTKLEVAKFAYGYTYDKGNYYQLNDAFNFESSIDDLNNYIKTKK